MMAVSTQNVNGPRDGEVKMTRFVKAMVDALCGSLKIIDKTAARQNFNTLMPLLITALSQCPSDSGFLILNLLNGIYDLAVAVGSEVFDQSQSEISSVIDPIMEALPVQNFFFRSFLSSFDKLCQLLDDNAASLKRSLIKMCIQALRFTLNDDTEPEASRAKRAKIDAFKFVSKWILSPNSFENLGDELLEVILDLIGKENEVEKLKMYVGVLHNLLDVVQRDETKTEPRRIWPKIWKILTRLIEEDRDIQLTTLCLKEISVCIETIETEIIVEPELNEIGLMVQRVLEKEMRLRENDHQSEYIIRSEETGGVLDRAINVYLRLFQKEAPICNIICHMMPIVFPLIAKCNDKHWGVRLVTMLIIYVPQSATQFLDDIVPLLFHSLTDNQSVIRRVAAHAFGEMAVSNIAQWKDIAIHSLDFVVPLVDRPDARDVGNMGATEDAISAVIKIIGNCDATIIGAGRINEIIVRFLRWFPLTGVSNECDVVYTFLMDLIDSNNPLIMGEPNTNSPRLLYILTKAIHDGVFGDDQESNDLEERTKNMIRQMANSSDSLNDWIRRSGLNQEEKDTLRRILARLN